MTQDPRSSYGRRKLPYPYSYVTEPVQDAGSVCISSNQYPVSSISQNGYLMVMPPDIAFRMLSAIQAGLDLLYPDDWQVLMDYAVEAWENANNIAWPLDCERDSAIVYDLVKNVFIDDCVIYSEKVNGDIDFVGDISACAYLEIVNQTGGIADDDSVKFNPESGTQPDLPIRILDIDPLDTDALCAASFKAAEQLLGDLDSFAERVFGFTKTVLEFAKDYSTSLITGIAKTALEDYILELATFLTGIAQGVWDSEVSDTDTLDKLACEIYGIVLETEKFGAPELDVLGQRLSGDVLVTLAAMSLALKTARFVETFVVQIRPVISRKAAVAEFQRGLDDSNNDCTSLCAPLSDLTFTTTLFGTSTGDIIPGSNVTYDGNGFTYRSAQNDVRLVGSPDGEVNIRIQFDRSVPLTSLYLEWDGGGVPGTNQGLIILDFDNQEISLEFQGGSNRSIQLDVPDQYGLVTSVRFSGVTKNNGTMNIDKIVLNGLGLGPDIGTPQP